MALIVLESGRTILVDVNIREPGDEIREVGADLRARLRTDTEGRPYVDAMLLSHPDQDRCRGLVEHFHLGALADYKKPPKSEPGKIIIREMWSSPMVFRRAEKDHTLCDDAVAWTKEARRRVAVYRNGEAFGSGNRIQILGEDQDGKTDDLTNILVVTGKTITTIDGNTDTSFRGRLLAPKGKGTAEEEERRSKITRALSSVSRSHTALRCTRAASSRRGMRKSQSGSGSGPITRMRFPGSTTI
jgi:hypothetical protein